MFNWFKKEKHYIIEIEFAKFKRCDPIRKRYSTHLGDKINNSFRQLYVKVSNQDTLIDECIEGIKNQFPEAYNFRITKIFKL